MILYEDMKTTEHFLLHPICVLSHLMCAMRTHANTALESCLYITEHSEVADEFITSKKQFLTRFVVMNPRHPG